MTAVVILGAGTAGTMLANKLCAALPDDHSVTVIDQNDEHHYQPGYLFVPFGRFPPERIARPRTAQLHPGAQVLIDAVARVEPNAREIRLASGRTVSYDWLIIASGTVPRADQTPGLLDERLWRKTAFDFYTLEGAVALRDALAAFEGGRLLVHISEMPIKCPVAPLEFAFLADDYFRKRRIRHKVDITYVTPLDGAFTKPVAAATLGNLLEDRSVRLAADFAVSQVDPATRHLLAYDGRSLGFDLLVTVPVNMGQQFVIDSGLGDDLGFVPVDKHTLRSVADPRIFAIGDATNVPTSKAGAVAHFEVDHLVANLQAAMAGRPLPSRYDGHANCFVESGRGKALLLDFNYDTEPLTGTFPAPVVGPLTLLGESRLNHLGKLAFEKVYWNALLPGRSLPVPTEMTMRGKIPAGTKV
ncbi:MAG: NAD(P)/FAD-dependent oxidoreductase [Tetrasphaera jenkinsii]|jgi:sulfide:quinone oxidoreductase|nr:NAD(P)/FAD-dependent oxidoreductase [Tetrasphaera jenkinsii]